MKFFASLNFETTDLLTDNFELMFDVFMIFVIYGLLLLLTIQICTASSDGFKILSQISFSQSKKNKVPSLLNILNINFNYLTNKCLKK